MTLTEFIEILESRKKRLFGFLPEIRRPYFDNLKKEFQNRAILLYGPRGAGKTTFLLIQALEKNLFYISADDPTIMLFPFLELAEKVLAHYPGIVIDEIHGLPNYGAILKTLYDSFPNKIIYACDSSSIIIRKSVADLSRRFVLKRLPLMSFREFIYLETGIYLEKITFPYEKLDEFCMRVIKQLDVLHYFELYSEKGTRPFYKEPDFSEKVLRTMEKVLYYDLPLMLGSTTENYFAVVKAMVSHLVHSKIPTINIESMSKEWGIGRAKIYEILKTLAEIDFLNIVYKKGKEKPFSKGEKMFFSDPVFYNVFKGEIGNFREAFVVFALKELGPVWACDNEQEGDFVFKDIKLEVGGKKKKIKSSDIVIRDDLDLPLGNKIPLWILGMLW
ncbi:ATP-binding protein [Pseudothermotoga thermarum]|uniref:AAA ATPase n=1 Tax=Pseudothermotoga thermarum DSM 5069 TaxID=688269 RepID=F7YUY2_9THEM|nr:AAA family ATPase [Pseudothermotoga thermarum]AEH51545.1 AAA ATPase [Pseudothermotoga thermarum DSM 5069]